MSICPIVDHLSRIAVAAANVPISEDLRDRISEIVLEHGLLTPPEWMIAFFCLLANGVSTRTQMELPVGYPEGESGIANILADIDGDITKIGVDDWGEGWQLDVRSLGVSVYVSHENGTKHLAVFSPTQTQESG